MRMEAVYRPIRQTIDGIEWYSSRRDASIWVVKMAKSTSNVSTATVSASFCINRYEVTNSDSTNFGCTARSEQLDG